MTRLLCDFWLGATRGSLKVGDQYNNSFTHPCLCLLHRVIMRSFHGHKEDTKVAMQDLRGFYSILPQAGFVPDWVLIFFAGL